MIIAPLASFDAIDLGEANRLLTAWGHRMGPISRPIGRLDCYALRHNGQPVGLAISADLVVASVAGFTRLEAIELARLCAARPHLCRPTLRLWREFVFPAIAEATRRGEASGIRWALTYQDESLHSGNTYRHDGWVELERTRSGTDHRSGRKGRNKRIWAWPRDAAEVHALRRPEKVAA